MNIIKEIRRINERELELNISTTASWHHEYRNSAYIFIGGLSPELSEGDVITLFSQFGEVVDLHLPRRKTVAPGTLGARMGFAFLAFEDQRSTILAIDNMNGWEMKLPGDTRVRTLRVDHAGKYRRPKNAAGAASTTGANAEEQAFDDVESNDAAYDERRRAIWDYEKYGTLDDGRRKLGVGELPDFNDLTASGVPGAAAATAAAAHVSSSDSREDAKHADRVMAMLAEKQRERERAKRGEEEQPAHAATGGAAASAAHTGSAPSAAAAAVSSSSSRHSSRRSRSPSPRRSRDERDRRRSRSRSRERRKEHRRSRSRERDRR